MVSLRVAECLPHPICDNPLKDEVVVQFEICRPSAAKAAMKIRLLTAPLKPCPFKTDSNGTTTKNDAELLLDESASHL